MSRAQRVAYFLADWAGCMLPAMLFIAMILNSAWMAWWI